MRACVQVCVRACVYIIRVRYALIVLFNCEADTALYSRKWKASASLAARPGASLSIASVSGSVRSKCASDSALSTMTSTEGGAAAAGDAGPSEERMADARACAAALRFRCTRTFVARLPSTLVAQCQV